MNMIPDCFAFSFCIDGCSTGSVRLVSGKRETLLERKFEIESGNRKKSTVF